MSGAELRRASGIQESVLSRFMQGAELRSGNFDKLCMYFGLELVARAESRKRKER